MTASACPDAAGLREGVEQGAVVVAVDLDDLPAEGAPLVGAAGRGRWCPRSGRPAAGGCGRRPRQVGRALVAGRHGRLPVAALLQLAVAGDDERAAGRAVDLGRERDADGDRQAVPERAGVRLDARAILVPVGVAVERRQRLHEGRQLGRRRRSRPAASVVYSAAAAWPLHRTNRSRSGSSGGSGLTFIDVQVQRHQDVDDRELAADVAERPRPGSSGCRCRRTLGGLAQVRDDLLAGGAGAGPAEHRQLRRRAAPRGDLGDEVLLDAVIASRSPMQLSSASWTRRWAAIASWRACAARSASMSSWSSARCSALRKRMDVRAASTVSSRNGNWSSCQTPSQSLILQRVEELEDLGQVHRADDQVVVPAAQVVVDVHRPTAGRGR